jgi:predicted DNA-binding transcriptional regulator AlpA
MNGEHKAGDGASLAPGTQRLERMAELQARVGLKKSQLFAMIRAGTFPKPIKCGRSSLFVACEVDDWIADRIRQSRGGAK